MKANGQTISGPYTHENLSVFLVHGPDTADTSTYVTLEEALDQQKVVVHETGNVSELLVENLLADKDLFIQAGEILRGGRQDRTLGVDFVVPARTKLPIPSFCVEMGRWHRRGGESAVAFSSSKHYLASKDLKLAAKMQASQHEVWNKVAATQAKLSKSVAASVCACESPSSLELTLDHEKVVARRSQYLKALAAIIDGKANATGFVFAINGRLNCAETYGSHALFTKLWKKLLDSAVVEAVAESVASAGSGRTGVPTTEAVRALLDDAEAAKDELHSVTDRVTLHTKRTRQTVLFETEDKALNARVHSNHIWEAD